jgi:putative transcriptional regulator
MRRKDIITLRLDPERPPKGNTDWKRLRAMTEDEGQLAALRDPDAPPMSDSELTRMQKVPDVRGIRKRMNLTQKEFAGRFQLSLTVLRDWEQKRTVPDQAARTLLRVIARNPRAVETALGPRRP